MASLASLEHGAGRPLIILHGLFGSARNWTTIVRRLGERRRAIALDLRNHGASPWTHDMDYPAMAEDVREVIAPFGRSAVLGHSMGGKAAMTLALLYPGLVERLVVVDIAPVAYAGRSHGDYIRAMQEADLSVERRAQVEEQLRDGVPDPALRAFLLQNLVSEEGGMRWRLNLDVLLDHMDEIMGWPDDVAGRRYDGPTLFLAGETSDYVRPEYHDRIKALFPQAEIRTVPKAGHWPHAEQTETFLRMVEEFL
jgi:esterase